MRPIKRTLNKAQKEALIKDYMQYIDTLNLTTDTINYSVQLDKPKIELPKIELYISTEAYLKMMLYVRDTNTEIAWHGTVNRKDNRFMITDVMLYPQTLAAATVTTDQEKYTDWLNELDDDTFNHLRFQGHSHVDFAVTPSGVDMKYYEDVVNTLSSTDYYIFMILNKRGETTFLIYDLATNCVYENADINIHILNSKNDIDLKAAITADKTKYCSLNNYTYPSYSTPKYKLDSYDYFDKADDYAEYERYFDSSYAEAEKRLAKKNKLKNKCGGKRK